MIPKKKESRLLSLNKVKDDLTSQLEKKVMR